MSNAAGVAAAGEVPVSIVLPTYNRAALLPASMESVLAQTFGGFELIVVDDGSSDDTESVVSDCRDDRIRYVKLARNKGLSGARNAGLDRIRGRYVAFQDSDDEWHAEKLARQLAAARAHPEAGVIYSDMHRRHRDGRVMYLHSPRIERGRLINPRTRFWQTYMLAMQPAMVKTEYLRGARFDEGLVMFEDLDLHMRMAGWCDYVHMEEPLVTYCETSGWTSYRPREQKGRWQLLMKYRKALVAGDPGFLLREAANALLRRSLMPIYRQHLSPL